MGNCCFRLPLPLLLPAPEAAFERIDSSNIDWMVLDHAANLTPSNSSQALVGDDTDIAKFSSNTAVHKSTPASTTGRKRRGLTIILTLQENSNVDETIRWIHKNADSVKNVLIGTPNRKPITNNRHQQQTPPLQPDWSSQRIGHLFEALASIPNLENLLLHEIGTTDNPLPLSRICTILCRRKPHHQLKQCYLVGTFDGTIVDCQLLARGLQVQPKLKSFALYGTATPGFCLDPILKAAATLPTLHDLHFHGNMPHPLHADAISAVGKMTQLQTLTVHSCDVNGFNLATLAKLLESSTSLKELTVFEAFEVFQSTDDDNDNNNLHLLPKDATVSCAAALYSLVQHSPSLEKVQIWFGFSKSAHVLIPFASALAQNPRIRCFETALLWTDYDETTASAFVDMLGSNNSSSNSISNHNSSLRSFSLHNYQGPCQWPLAFYLRLNQTGRKTIEEQAESMSAVEWIDDVLTAIPQTGLSATTMESFGNYAPKHLQEDWFDISWVYYYLRQNPSLCYLYADDNIAKAGLVV